MIDGIVPTRGGNSLSFKLNLKEVSGSSGYQQVLSPG
jgi:hypothetical protein